MVYNRYKIPKKKGFRVITEPSSRIKPILQILNDELSIIKLHDKAHGFVEGRSCITNARSHQCKKYVLNIDVKNFFPSIKQEDMMQVLVSYQDKHPQLSSLFPWIEALCFYEGVLPQGACTSPTLSNIYMNRVDEILDEYSIKLGLVYSRYADDLTFSCEDDYLKQHVNAVIGSVGSVLGAVGLRINKKKVKLMPYYQRQVVTGIVVNNKRLTLARSFKDQIFLSFKDVDVNDLTEADLGLLSYIKSIDKVFYKKLYAHMKENKNE